MNGDLLAAFGFASLFGLWWMLAPNTTLRFYRAFGNKEIPWLGPRGVRAIGATILALTCSLTATILIVQLTR
jgi:hypothetical protein